MSPLSRRDFLKVTAATVAAAQIPPMFGQPTPGPSRSIPAKLRAEGSVQRVHDPVIARERDAYYVFSTGRGISLRRSKDGVHWEELPPVLEKPPGWTVEAVPGFKDHIWAPDISFFRGRWHLYYSVSTFGKNRSAIGLLTSASLNPASAAHGWKDEGLVVRSTKTDDWNTIDPNVAFDNRGDPWLSFGSYWSGLKIVPLDPSTGKPKAGEDLVSIARRPQSENGGAIEAPFIVRHAGWYFLFASFDQCCRGVLSTYNVRVGRAKEITGPYVDRAGRRMLDGGGTLLIESEGRWRGPGHCAVYSEGGKDWLIYHSYDAEANGTPTLRIQPLKWDMAAWPAISA